MASAAPLGLAAFSHPSLNLQFEAISAYLSSTIIGEGTYPTNPEPPSFAYILFISAPENVGSVLKVWQSHLEVHCGEQQ